MPDTPDTLSPLTLDFDARGMHDSADRTRSTFSGLNTEMRTSLALGKQFGSSLGRAFEGLALQGRGLGDVVRQLGLSLSRIAFRAAFKPLENAIGSAFSSLLTGVTAPAAGGLGKAGAPMLSASAPIPFAKGGVIGSPVTFPLGRGTGLAGERGAEAILPLARGPDGRLGVAASGASGGPMITFNISTPDADSFRRTETQIAALLQRAVGSGSRNL